MTPFSEPGRISNTDAAQLELILLAIGALRDLEQAEPARTFPSRGQDVDLPGLYSWWADAEAAHLVGDILETQVSPLIYAGQAGAGKKNPTLGSRILKMHLWTKINFSTFRLSLASMLCDRLELSVVRSKALSIESESILTEWMKEHLSVRIFPLTDRAGIRQIERQVLLALDPPINLMGMPKTPARARLSKLRAEVMRGRCPFA